MGTTGLISLLLIFLACVSAQTLVETGGGVQRPGATLQLTCTVSGFSLTSYHVHWARQAPGKGLQWIGLIWNSGGTAYSPALKTRTSITKDNSKSQAFLQMTGLQPEDTAMYYCAREHGAAYYGAFDYWGPGTMVTVTSATPTAPSVFPLSPCCEDLSNASEVTFGCLVSGFFPEPVTVQWNKGAISTGIRNFPPAVISGGLSTSISQLTVPAAKWKDEKFQCNVAHGPTSTRVDSSIQPCKKNAPVAPTVRVLHSPCKPQSTGATVELMCIISGFNPANVEVSWLENNEPKSLYPSTDRPWKDSNGYTFSTVSTVNVSQADWLNGASYACQVTHQATSSTVKSQAGKCADDGTLNIKVYTLSPDPKDLYMDKKPKLTCIVVNLETDEGLVVSWSQKNPGTLVPASTTFSDQSNGTITATSQVLISTEAWENGDVFTCRVEHPIGLAGSSIDTEISKETGDPTAPNIYLFRPHHEELNSRSQHVTITALVQGFKPRDISVEWIKNGQTLTDNHAVTPVLNDGEDTYFLVSKLKVLRGDWNRGDVYTFMVVHQGLSMKFIQKSIQKTQGK